MVLYRRKDVQSVRRLLLMKQPGRNRKPGSVVEQSLSKLDAMRNYCEDQVRYYDRLESLAGGGIRLRGNSKCFRAVVGRGHRRNVGEKCSWSTLASRLTHLDDVVEAARTASERGWGAADRSRKLPWNGRQQPNASQRKKTQ